jgi:hypothetical protein
MGFKTVAVSRGGKDNAQCSITIGLRIENWELNIGQIYVNHYRRLAQQLRE